MLAAGLIIFGLSAPTKKYPDACDRGKELVKKYKEAYGSCKAQETTENWDHLRWCYGGYNRDSTSAQNPTTTGMKYPQDFLSIQKMEGCKGEDDCPAYGVFEGNYFYFNNPGYLPDFFHWEEVMEGVGVLTPSEYFDKVFKGYCYVEYKSFNSQVSDSYANNRFNVTTNDFLFYPEFLFDPGPPTEWLSGYSEHVFFGCDDEEETKFNLTEGYLGTKTLLPPKSEHKCKKGARSAFYKYDGDDDEYYRLEHSLTDFWGTVKHTVEEQGGIRTYKTKVGLSNKLSVAAGIGIAVAVSAVVVAIGCLIFYCVCKSKSAVKS